MAHEKLQDVLCNMCMVYDDKGKILVQIRTKKDWPGLTFPGGHVEKNETIEESVRREMLEETGLRLKKVEFCGFLEWPFPGIDHYIAFIYRCGDYDGEIHSSKEGEVFFVDRKDIDKYPLSMDMDKILDIAMKGLFKEEGNE